MSPTGDILNLIRNLYGSCLAILPHPISRYASNNMDTVPKFLTHTLVAMGVCNVFLLFSSLAISFLTFLASLLLAIQSASLLLATTSFGQSFAPRLFRPTEFMLGVCLGITIGGAILAFFLCLTFGRIHAYCSHHPSGPDSCGWRTGSLNGVWWWSSCIFWFNLLSCSLLVGGHSEIAATVGSSSASSSANAQYQSLDQQDMDNNHIPPGTHTTTASIITSQGSNNNNNNNNNHDSHSSSSQYQGNMGYNGSPQNILQV